MKIAVAYHDSTQQSWLHIELPDESRVEQAIAASGILERHPHIDLASQRVGVFGKTVKLDAVLREGDRVEIYRAITCDPLSVPRRPGFELDAD